MKKSEIVKLILATGTMWPHWKAPEQPDTLDLAVGTWHVVLEDIPEGLAFAALHSLAASGREFAPPVGVIRQTAVQLSIRARGEECPGIDQAWTEVQTQIRRFGYQHPPDWSHDAIERAVAAFGWRELCLTDNQDAARAHFFRLYQSIVDRIERDEHTPAAVVEQVRATLDVPRQPTMPLIGRRIE